MFNESQESSSIIKLQKIGGGQGQFEHKKDSLESEEHFDSIQSIYSTDLHNHVNHMMDEKEGGGGGIIASSPRSKGVEKFLKTTHHNEKHRHIPK